MDCQTKVLILYSLKFHNKISKCKKMEKPATFLTLQHRLVPWSAHIASMVPAPNGGGRRYQSMLESGEGGDVVGQAACT